MNEQEIKKMLSEFLIAQEQVFAFVAATMSRQMDAERLLNDMRAQLSASIEAGAMSSLAQRIASHAIAAVEAETALRNPAKH